MNPTILGLELPFFLTESETLELWLAAAALLLAVWRPRLLRRWFGRWERQAAQFARRPWRGLLVCGLFPVILRLLTVSLYPPAIPKIADEFGYLLLADTFAHGRLTNPPHPLWQHFETIYVLHQPTYTSIYPLGMGVVYGLAQILHVPLWFAVALVLGGLCAAIYWMIEAWLPPHWALLGGLLAALHLTVFSQWMHSYWGGGLAALGGALVLGAVPRLMRSQRPLHACLFLLGIATVINTRPYEGVMLSVLPCAAVAWWLISNRTVPLARRLLHVALPIALLGAGMVAFLAYYNWRVTGSPFVTGYQLHRTAYGTPQTFYWQPPVPAPHFRHKAIEDCYEWQLAYRKVADSKWRLLDFTAKKARAFWSFFIGPLLSIPLLTLFCLRFRWSLALPFSSGLLMMIGVALYPFFFPHYTAPVTGTLFLAVAVGLRRLRAIRFRGARAGLALGRWVILALALSVVWQIWEDIGNRDTRLLHPLTPRAQVEQRLLEGGGKHLVIVSYGPDHVFHNEIVYNAADIDASPIVWARDMERDNDELLRYYQNRTVWIFQPDAKPPRLSPYNPGTR